MQLQKLKKISSTKLSSTTIKNIAGIMCGQKLYISDPENGIVVFNPLTKSISEVVDLKGLAGWTGCREGLLLRY